MEISAGASLGTPGLEPSPGTARSGSVGQHADEAVHIGELSGVACTPRVGVELAIWMSSITVPVNRVHVLSMMPSDLRRSGLPDRMQCP